LGKLEVAFCWLWLDHVVHLAEEVDEENRLMIKVFKSVNLLFVEVVHLMGRNDLVVIQVDHFEPVLQRSKRGLVLLGQHEPHEVLVAHFVFLAGLEFARNLVEDAVHCFAGQGVAFVAREVLLVNQEVVICIQLPKTAVQHVEMLVGEVLAHFVDVFLPSYLEENVHEI